MHRDIIAIECKQARPRPPEIELEEHRQQRQRRNDSWARKHTGGVLARRGCNPTTVKEEFTFSLNFWNMKPMEASECGKNGQIFTRQSTCLSDSQKCCKFDFYIGPGGWGGCKWMGTGKKWVFSILIKWHSLRIICRAHNTNITYVCTYI